MGDALRQAIEEETRAMAPLDLDRDLWPRMRARLDAPPGLPTFLDWALAAAVVGAALMFPELILGVLYHL